MRWIVALLLTLAACKGSRNAPPPPDAGIGDLFAMRPIVPVPPDWPTDVPVYKNARVFSAGSHNVDGGWEREIMFDTFDAMDIVIGFYRTSFPAMTRTYERAVPMGMVSSYEAVGRIVSVVVMSYGNATNVILTIAPS